MIQADKFIYVGMPKTGSTNLHHIMHTVGGVKLRTGPKYLRHCITLVPTNSYADKLIVGSIRNPWAWYLSYWADSCRRGGSGPYKKRLKENNTEIIEELTDKGSVDQFRAWLSYILTDTSYVDFLYKYSTSLYNHRAGWMTHLYMLRYIKNQKQFTQANVDIEKIILEQDVIEYWIHTETLDADVLRLFRSLKINCKSTRKYIKTGKRMLQNQYIGIKEAYNQELVDLVAEKDAVIINKFKYDYV